MLGRILARIRKQHSNHVVSRNETPEDTNEASSGEKPIILHKAALEADDPFVPLEMISRFTYALISERGYAHDEIPPRAFALFLAGKFIFKITEETFASWLENMGPLKPEWLERAADIFAQASLSGHAGTLRRLAAWMQQNPGRDPARALAEGDPVLKEIKATTRQLAAQTPPAHIWPALLRTVRTWPELLVVDARSEAELMAVFDRYYPPRSRRDGSRSDETNEMDEVTAWEAFIRDQFLHPAMVAAAMLTIARKEFISGIRRLSRASAEMHAWLVETNNKGPRILTMDKEQVALHEAVPIDFTNMGLEGLVRPEDHAALQSMLEKMKKEMPAYTTGRRLLALPRRCLDACVRWAAEIDAADALIKTVRKHYRERPRVIVLWDWPIEPARLEEFLEKLRSRNMGLWHVAIKTDMDRHDRLFRFHVQPNGTKLILEYEED